MIVSGLLFKLKTGREVSLESFLLKPATQGMLLYNNITFHKDILSRSAEEAKRLFGDHFGFILREPTSESIPKIQIYIELISYEFADDYDFSAVVFSCFENEIPENIYNYISNVIVDIDWEAHAMKGDL